MFPKAGRDGDVAQLPVYAKSAREKSSLPRLFSYIALLSTAVTLSTLLPTPWSLVHRPLSRLVQPQRSTDPASKWQDNIWPIREQTPWDISTDYPYPRSLEYDVTEGTWLRLDVHPVSGDIAFDMLGDIYCLPGHEALKAHDGRRVRARPILLGVPYDSDPHFSPQGDRLVFTSDAGLGLENIWVTEWKGCEAMDVRAKDTNNDELKEALRVKVREDELMKKGVRETKERKHHRLVREGRAGAHRVTNETFRLVSDARFHPSGSKVVATKWYTTSRSLGVGEGWEYEVPTLKDLHHHQKHVAVGSGSRVQGRTLPRGWTIDDYQNLQVGPEQLIWKSEDIIIFAKNSRDQDTFNYSKDVHNGIYSIFQKNMTTGEIETLVGAFPGGASMPILSRDRRTLAFVRRVRDKEALVLKDLQSGTLHHVWHGLDYDESIVIAPMGTYPSYAFTPSDNAVIIWASGQIYRVPLKINQLGEKVAADEHPSPIPFTAHVDISLAKTLRGGVDVLKQETAKTQRVRAFRDLRVDSDGERAVFEGAGATYIHEIQSHQTHRIPVADKNAPYYSPTFVHGRKDLVVHAHWSDTGFTSFELANLDTGASHRIEGLPSGRYFSPAVCECSGSSRRLAFIKSAGSYLTGDVVANAAPGLYIADFDLPPHDGAKVVLRNIQFIKSSIDPDGRVQMRFAEGANKLLIQQSRSAFIINLKQGPFSNGYYTTDTIASGRMSTELTVSPTKKGGVPEWIAFVDFFHVYIAPWATAREGGVWSKPGNATEGLARLSLDGGHDITWSRDGKRVFWFLGPILHSLEVSKLQACSSQIDQDTLDFGISCVKNLVKYLEIFAEHSTDIARLQEEAAALWGTNNDSDVLVITNATLLTMATGNMEDDLIKEGVLVTRGGVIEAVGPVSSNIHIPAHAQTINAQGGFVIPGFVDAHAHWEGWTDRYPVKSWEMETFLAYGVTTLHNPSADNVNGFIERTRVERGQLIGPRIYTVGHKIYGAALYGVHQDITTLKEAESALLRIKAEGGPASISYKNYNIPSRASRQRLLLAATNLSMLCVPEGGMDYDWDLTYIIDGMTTLEHSFPVPMLYDDVVTLFASTGSGYTPTYIVNYGGVAGEQFVWANYDVPNDPKLRKFTRHDLLEGVTETTSRPLNSFAFFNASASAAKIFKKGALVQIGAHGETPLGLNYHAEMWFTKQGGLSNYEVIRAATSSGAHTLGMSSSLGSLSEGKLADYLIYPPGVDLLNNDLNHTLELTHVARGGRLWNTSTMEEIWPVKGRKQEMPPFNAE